MAATRRRFLAGLAAASLPRLTWADAGQPAYVAAAMGADGAQALHGLSRDGAILFTVPLPARGHAAAAHPERPEVVAFARRPGTFALVMNAATGTVAHRLTPPQGHHFNGHGTSSADGAVLFTTEQRADTSEGRLGLWDGATYARIGTVPTGGIGPHDVLCTPAGLVVANGGIATDPTDRTKLNLADMRPNLAVLRAADGALDALITLDPALHQLSIRHLAATPDGVAFAMQWEGDPAEAPPLLGLWAGGRVQLCALSEGDAPRLRNYAASIACAGDEIAITSPPGGVVARFGRDGTSRGLTPRTDAAGIAPRGAGFIVTDGTGAVTTLKGGEMAPLATGGPAWDNHLIAIG
jgi:hypothetical protein